MLFIGIACLLDFGAQLRFCIPFSDQFARAGELMLLFRFSINT